MTATTCRLLQLLTLVTLSACGRPTASTTGDSSDAFPHPEDYARQHPIDAELDSTGCLYCHGADEDDAPAEAVIPHCSTCHTWPPPESR